MITSIGIKIIKALHKKEIYGAIDLYAELDKKINNTERNKILSKISKSTEEKIIYFLISYFETYKINYISNEEKPKKPRNKESNESIKKRQKTFIERKKSTGAKKVQIYISEEAHNKLKSLKERANLSYSEIIQNLILEK